MSDIYFRIRTEQRKLGDFVLFVYYIERKTFLLQLHKYNTDTLETILEESYHKIMYNPREQTYTSMEK